MLTRRSRPSAPEPKILSIRPLTREDLAILTQKREQNHVQRLRDSHHAIARLDAQGLRVAEIAEITGYTLARVYTLRQDPAYQNMVAEYRAEVREGFVDAVAEEHRQMNRVRRKALTQMETRLDIADEDGVPLPIRELLPIFSDMSDRVGTPKKSVGVNVNVDFAAQLEKAIERKRKAAPLIEHDSDESAA